MRVLSTAPFFTSIESAHNRSHAALLTSDGKLHVGYGIASNLLHLCLSLSVQSASTKPFKRVQTRYSAASPRIGASHSFLQLSFIVSESCGP